MLSGSFKARLIAFNVANRCGRLLALLVSSFFWSEASLSEQFKRSSLKLSHKCTSSFVKRTLIGRISCLPCCVAAPRYGTNQRRSTSNFVLGGNSSSKTAHGRVKSLLVRASWPSHVIAVFNEHCSSQFVALPLIHLNHSNVSRESQQPKPSMGPVVHGLAPCNLSSNGHTKQLHGNELHN